MPTETKIPTAICPACGAIDPETEFHQAPALLCYATGYDESFSGYRCLVCDTVSETEDWDRLAREICCECGKIGRHSCPADEEDELERARRRAPILTDVAPDFKFIRLTTEKEAA